MTHLRIVFLGTSAATPTGSRGLSATAIQRGDELLLFDAGEGVQQAIAKAGLGLNRRMKIFITHIHGDHTVGLLGLLQSMSMTGRDKSLDIYGPERVWELVKEVRRILGFVLTFPVRFTKAYSGVIVDEEEYVVKAARSEHEVDSYAYCIEERDRPGAFHRENAIRLGVPEGELWSRLQHGQPVIVGDKKILPRQVLGPKRRGRRIGVSGDTRPNSRLTRFFKDCDVLIFDSTYGDDQAERAVENLHATAREAAMLARNAGASLLVLTHFSARYTDVSPLLFQAAEVHPKVMAATDQMAFDIPYPEDW
ncbi:MAG: ribonuclease Z [Thaumarchaeota archaeon]|nr:ribonuclease Z [Nitrososphaerota archaeon]